jgi:hypothetical protein
MNFTRDFSILKTYLQTVEDIDLSNVFIAGGALRDYFKGKEYKDIDVYFDSLELAEVVSNQFESLFSVKMKSQFAISFNIPGIKVPVQFIKILSGTPETVVEQFDFTVNTNYILMSENPDYIKPRTSDFSLKLLDKCKTPCTLLHRTLKLLEVGYEIETKELIKVLDVVKESVTNLNKYSLKNKHLIGSYYSVGENKNYSKGIKKVARKAATPLSTDDNNKVPW